MLLTVEKEKINQGEIALCFDQEGLEFLIDALHGFEKHLTTLT